MMPRARALALVSLAILVLAPATVSATSVALPRWNVGDEWTFEVKLVENGATIQTGEKHVVVTARGPAPFHGASRDTVTMTTWLNMTGDPPQQWSDLRDAATGAFLATTSGGSTTEAAEPCADIEYPLEMNDRWTSICDLGGGPSETSYQVVGGETLVLPAGAYDTLTVDGIGNDVFRMWFADEACGQVAEFSQTNDLATYTNLTAVRCTRATPPTPPATSSPPATPTTTPTGTPTPTGPTPGAAPATLSLPKFTTQDNWHYESTGVLGGASYRVNTTASVAVGGTDARFNGNVNVTDAKGATVLAYIATSSIDTTTGAVRSEHVSPYVGRDLFVASGISMEERRYDAPCAFVHWPITPGQEWTFSCQGKSINASRGGEDLAFTVSGTGRAEPVRQVTTPAGTFTTFPVRLSYTYSDGFSRTETRAYAADPCAHVQMSPGPWGGVDELVGYYCASTQKGGLVPEELPDRPTPGVATWTLVALGAAVALALRRKPS